MRRATEIACMAALVVAVAGIAPGTDYPSEVYITNCFKEKAT